MGKSWDNDKGGRDQWIAWLTSIMKEALRVLKPGGHCLVWALPRTSHWTATALENAGFEIRDVIHHLFGSGFPKSLDVSKAIDTHFKMEREVVGEGPYASRKPRPYEGGNALHISERDPRVGHPITAPATDEARQYAGFGTNLKPAAEHWILCRKPLSERNIAENVLKWGVGALNIDASRVSVAENEVNRRNNPGVIHSTGLVYGKESRTERAPTLQSKRFPAHLVLSHSLFCTEEQCFDGCPVLALDEQSGVRKSGGRTTTEGTRRKKGMFGGDFYPDYHCDRSEGGASRYFQQFRPMVDDGVTSLYNGGNNDEVNQCQKLHIHGDTSASETDAGTEDGAMLEAANNTANLSIDGSGSKHMDPSRKVTKSITSTTTRQTTTLKTCNLSPLSGMTTITRDSEKIIKSTSKALKNDGAVAENTGNHLTTSTSGEQGHITDTASNAAQRSSENGVVGTKSIVENTNDSENCPSDRYFAQFRPDVPPFYYAGKASQKERNAGCEALPTQRGFDKNTSTKIAHINPETGKTTYSEYKPSSNHNHHPTVKPLKLVEHLATLITPPNGVILDMFAGSGTTGVAAVHCGFRYVLIEQSPEYVEIARARIEHAQGNGRRRV
jgi:hypothetical protein